MLLRLRKIIFLIAIIFNSSIGFAQLNEGGTPVSFQVEKQITKSNARGVLPIKRIKRSNELPSHSVGNVSDKFIRKLIVQDSLACPTCRAEAYGFNIGMEIDVLKVAAKELLDDGTTLYRFKVISDSANGFQFVFKDFVIPNGGRLYVYNEAHTMVIGAFTSNNNVDGGVYALQPVMGNSITIEYSEPKGVTQSAKLILENIIYVFSESLMRSGFGPYASSNALSCTIDVNCSVGNGWESEVKSVGLILKTNSPGQLSNVGTGALLNNTKFDGAPFFLTANHLYDDFNILAWPTYDWSKAVILFNHETAACDGDAHSVQTTNAVSGASLLTRDNVQGVDGFSTDYMLLQLNEKPIKYNVCFSGWSSLLADANQSGMVSISHPRGDVKKIAIADANLPKVLVGHLRYGFELNWNQGITQPGSSGSPLYNSDHRIVGQLFGGNSDCSKKGPDYYGRFDKSFTLGNLNNWLTPGSSSILQMDTYCPNPIATKVVDFKVDKTEVLVNQKISVTNLTINASGTITYTWYFGATDDVGPVAFSTDMNPPSFFYKTSGAKTITLEVCDKDGCVSEIKNYYILVTSPSKSMVVDFFADDESVTTGSNVTFTSSVAGNSGAVKYNWDFGDGALVPPGMGQQANPTVSWKTDGNKTISLIVTDNKGTAIETKAYYIYVFKDLKKILDVVFKYDKPVFADRTTSFTSMTLGASSFNSGDSFLWDFGDGTTSTLESPFHKYARSGIYTVKLTICNSSGCYEKIDDWVNVSVPFQKTDFAINGSGWQPGEDAIIIGSNTPVEIAYRGTKELGDAYRWDLDYSSSFWHPEIYGFGPHNTYFEGHGLKSIYLYKSNDFTGNVNSMIKRNCILIVKGRGPGTCQAVIGDVTMSSQCYNNGGAAIRFTIPMSKANCKFSKRVSSPRCGVNPLNDTTLRIPSGATFPFTDDFTFEIVHDDGINLSIIDRKSIRLTFYNSTSMVLGSTIESCPGITHQLGVSIQSNASYTWSASPAYALNYLSATNIPNPTVTPTLEGDYYFYLRTKDLSSSCASTSMGKLKISNISIVNKAYEVSKGDPVTFSLLPSGGAGWYNSYLWSPSTYLSSTTIISPTMATPSIPGVYEYVSTANDYLGCVGSGKTTVMVSATAPSNLLTSNTLTEVQLDWLDNAVTETAYYVYRSTNASTGFTILATLPSNSSSYTDKTLEYGIEYFYKINAVEGEKNLGYSNVKAGKLQYVGEDIGTLPVLTNSMSTFYYFAQPNVNGDWSSSVSLLPKTIKTSDGGYLICGSIWSNFKTGNINKKSLDYYVVKYNSCGVKEWENVFGGDNYDALTDVVETATGYILAGSSVSGISGDRSYAVRGANKEPYLTDKNNPNFFGSDWYCGYSDYWIVSIGKNGVKLFDRAYGGNRGDHLAKIITTLDGGYLLAGTSFSSGGLSIFEFPPYYEKSRDGVNKSLYDDIWVVKIDANGNVQFDKTYSNDREDYLIEVGQSIDGSYYFIGQTDIRPQNIGNPVWGIRTAPYKPAGTAYDIWVLRTDLNGNKINDFSIGFPEAYYTDCRSFRRISGGNFLMTGDYKTANNEGNYVVALLDYKFNFIWVKEFGGDNEDDIIDVTKTYDQNYLLYGRSWSGKNGDKTVSPAGNWVVKIDPNGNKLWDHNIVTDMGFYSVNYIEEISDKNFIVQGDGKLKIYTPDNSSPYLKTGKITPLSYYLGESMKVPFVAKCSGNGNTYTVQLSSEYGDFDTYTVIGSLKSSALLGVINCQIPFSVVPGNGYRVRVVSNKPTYTAKDNGEFISIKSPEIITSVINPRIYLSGQTVNVNFTLKGLLESTNVFTVQLSNDAGSFTTPRTLGTFAGTFAASYSILIPAGLTFSDKYRIRVISSSLSIIGKDNGSDLTIGGLFTDNPQPLFYMQGDDIVVSYRANATFNAGNVFTLQLSNATGSFVSPVTIGSVTSVNSGVFNAKLSTTVSPGVKYRVRVVSSSPSMIGLVSTSNITISAQSIITKVISPLSYLSYDAVTVDYDVTGSFSSGNIFTAELSDSKGVFENPITIGTLAGTGSGTINCIVPGILFPGYGYRIRVVASAPSRIGSDNGDDIRIGGLMTGTLDPLVYYSGNAISIPYFTNLTFGASNVFTAQLSDSKGLFGAPKNIGTLSATGAGVIQGLIPVNALPGDMYRIRVVSSSPYVWSLDNGQDISIIAPIITITSAPNADLCRGNYIDIPYTVSGNFAEDNNFVIELSDGSGNFVGATVVNVTEAVGSGTLKAYLTDEIPSGIGYAIRIKSTNPISISNVVPISIVSPVITYPNGLNICKGSGDFICLSATQNPRYTYEWLKDDVVIGGATARNYYAFESGAYKVRITDPIVGCSKTSSAATINIELLPTVSISNKDNGQVCPYKNISYAVAWENPLGADLSPDLHSFISNGSTTSAPSATASEFLLSEGYFELTVKNPNFKLYVEDKTKGLQYSFFAQVINGVSKLAVVENNQIYSYTNTIVGDKLKIAFEAGAIVYYINGVLVYTSLVKPVLPITCSYAIYYNNSAIGTVSSPVSVCKYQDVSFDAVCTDIVGVPLYTWYVNDIIQSATTSSFVYKAKAGDDVKVKVDSESSCGKSIQANLKVTELTTAFPEIKIETSPDNVICGDVIKNVTWKSLVGVSTSGSSLTKTNTVAGWNAGASSNEGLLEGDFVYYTITALTDLMFGLSKTDLDVNYTSIENAFSLTSSGQLKVYESGTIRQQTLTYSVGDVLMIGVELGKVVYYKNNVKVYTSAASYSVPLIIDVSLYKTITMSVVIKHRNQQRSFLVTGIGKSLSTRVDWYKNDVLERTKLNDLTFLSSVASGDIIYAKVTASERCDPSAVISNTIIFNSVPQVTAVHDFLCTGESLTLSTVKSDVYAYTWYKDGVLIPNETTNILTVSALGKYQVKFNSVGCGNYSNVFDLSTIKSPPIINLPSSVDVCKGESVSLSASSTERTYLLFDGVDDYITGFAPVAYNPLSHSAFQAWVLPTATHEMDVQSISGNAGLTGQRYLLYPMEINATTVSNYLDYPNAITYGVSVGTNGVSVYERRDNYFPAVLVWQGVITSWTHVTVVYRDFVPYLYINGVLVKTGLKSGKGIIPSTFIGAATNSYKGNLDDVRFYYYSITDQQIIDTYNNIEIVMLPNAGSVLSLMSLNEGKGDKVSVLVDQTSIIRTYTLVGGPKWIGPAYIWSNGSTILSAVGDGITVQPSVSSTYSVSLVGANSCSVTKDVSVNVIEPKRIHCSEDVSICAGNETLISAERFPSFDGLTSDIVSENFEMSNVGGSLSISTWIKIPSSLTDDAALFSAGNYGDRLSAYVSASDKHLYFDYGLIGDANFRMDIDFNPYFDKWINVVLVSGGLLQDYRAIYIDGQLISSYTLSTGNTTAIKSITIGNFFGSKFLVGSMRDFLIWERVLTANEIMSLAIEKPISDLFLLIDLPMHEGRGDFLKDRSINNSTAIIRGGVIWENDNSSISSLLWSPINSGLHLNAVAPNTTKEYKVSGVDGNNCKTSEIVNVAIDQACPNYNTINFLANSNQVLSAPNINLYKLGNADFTFEFKVKLSPQDKGGSIVSTRPNGFLAIISNWGGGTLILQLSNGTYYFNYESNPSLQLFDGKCHHIAMVRSGNNLTFYVDGLNVGNKTLSSYVGLYNSANKLNLGFDNLDGSFDGKVMEIRMWNIARTQNELRVNVDTKFNSLQNNLIGDWSGEESKGQYITDRSYASNDAVLGNFGFVEKIDPLLSYELCVPGAKSSTVDFVAIKDSINLLVSNVLIKPNPCESLGAELFISNSVDEFSMVTISDVNGVVLLKLQMRNGQVHTILENVSQGVYFINIQSSTDCTTYKVIKI